MSDLTEQEQAAMESVAKRFSAKWKNASSSADAYLEFGRKRIAVQIATLTLRGSGRYDQPRAKVPCPRFPGDDKPGLRFDKVATRLMQSLQGALDDTIPDNLTVLLSVTAPIRLPARTSAALEAKIQTLLSHGLPRRGEDEKETLHGNRIQIRVLKAKSDRAPKLIGFVHNPDSDPDLLMDVTKKLLDLSTGKAGSRTEDRWLLLVSSEAVSWVEAYRHIVSHLRAATQFKKILVAFGNGSIEELPL
jgi:hypothetical protein